MLVLITPKNHLAYDQLTIEDDLVADDLLAFQDVSEDGVASRATTYSNILAIIKTAMTNDATVGAATTGQGSVWFGGNTPPSGWLLCDGATIGSDASGATSRANDDTFPLFELLWGAWANGQATIQTSAGSDTVRGASAVEDFDADKRLPLPDTRGRVLAGMDVSAGRLSLVGANMGSAGGVETITLSEAQMPTHDHDVTFDEPGADGSATASLVSVTPASPSSADVTSTPVTFATPGTPVGATKTTTTAGSSQAHDNVQPTMVARYMIRM